MITARVSRNVRHTPWPWRLKLKSKSKAYVASYEVPTGQMVQAGISGRSEKKDNERVKKRKPAGNAPRRDVSQYGERVEAPLSGDVSAPYLCERYGRSHLLQMQRTRKRKTLGSTPTLTI